MSMKKFFIDIQDFVKKDKDYKFAIQNITMIQPEQLQSEAKERDMALIRLKRSGISIKDIPDFVSLQ